MTLFAAAGYEEVMRTARRTSRCPRRSRSPRPGPGLGRSRWRSCSTGRACRWRPRPRRGRSTGTGGWSASTARPSTWRTPTPTPPPSAGPGPAAGTAAFPQLRVVALGECGTHAVIAARMDSYSVGEVTLAKQLVAALKPGMLCLADRGFTAHPLFAAAAASGAALVWRAKGNAVFPVLQRLPDGSFVSELVATADKRRREDVCTVRVIEYVLDDPGRPGAQDTTYRLVTTLLDPTAAPAGELAALYAQRWEIESIFDELKTHQRGPRVILRSRTPAGVYQVDLVLGVGMGVASAALVELAGHRMRLGRHRASQRPRIG